MYDALFRMDQAINNRFNVMQETLNGVSDRITTHEQTHNREESVAVVNKVVTEVATTTARKATIGAGLASIVVVIAASIKQLVNNNQGAAWW